MRLRCLVAAVLLLCCARASAPHEPVFDPPDGEMVSCPERDPSPLERLAARLWAADRVCAAAQEVVCVTAPCPPAWRDFRSPELACAQPHVVAYVRGRCEPRGPA